MVHRWGNNGHSDRQYLGGGLQKHCSLLEFICIELGRLFNHVILCHPLLLLHLIFHSIPVFSNELALPIMLSKYWSFRFRISPSSEYSQLISFRMDWFDLLAVQGALKSLLQPHSGQPIFYFYTVHGIL